MCKRYLLFAFLAATSLGITSCGKERDPLKESYGYLRLSLTDDQKDVILKTKADEPLFSVNILNSAGVIVRSVADHRELEAEPMKLRGGVYTIQATSGEQVDCAFEKPFYSAQESITIAAGSIQNCSLVCKLANSKVSVEMDSGMDAYFREYVVMVHKSGSNSGLLYSSQANTIHNAGYFTSEGSLSWSLYVVNHNGVVFDGEVKGTIPNIKPKEHYILRFKVSETDGGGGASNLTIVVDDSVNEKVYDFEIDMNKKPKPVYGSEGFDLMEKQWVKMQTTLPWKVSVDSKAGLLKMGISHHSPTLFLAGIPYSFDLFNLSPAEKAAIQTAGLIWDDVNPGTESISIDFSGMLRELPLGEYALDLSALDQQHQMRSAVFRFEMIPGVETTALAVEPWAKQAFFYGAWNTPNQPEGLGIEYKKATDSDWIQIEEGFQITDNQYSVKVRGLEPGTAYVMRTYSAGAPSNEIEFTTEKAEQIPNMSFDKWYKEGKQWYANESASNFWWDSGNKGANALTDVNPTAPTTTVLAVTGVGKQAAKLETKMVLGMALAAGNLYLGQYGKTIGTSGAEIYFGRPYTCRPLSMKGYYSYIPKAISSTKPPYDHLKGSTDVCHIYVILTDWATRFTINTSEKKFINIADDPNIIAFGELIHNANTGGYQAFEIPLIYRNKRTPTHCVIVASASKYGDYFTGGAGSILYIDEFEFTF